MLGITLLPSCWHSGQKDVFMHPHSELKVRYSSLTSSASWMKIQSWSIFGAQVCVQLWSWPLSHHLPRATDSPLSSPKLQLLQVAAYERWLAVDKTESKNDLKQGLFFFNLEARERLELVSISFRLLAFISLFIFKISLKEMIWG